MLSRTLFLMISAEIIWIENPWNYWCDYRDLSGVGDEMITHPHVSFIRDTWNKGSELWG
jgi:hypothetical protein